MRARLLAPLALAACTNAQLYDLGEQGTAPVDRQLEIDGKFCALGPDQVVSPIKILFIMDASGSIVRSDPTGSRATAIVNLIQSLPANPNIYFAVMLFSGSDTRMFTLTGNAVFDPVTAYSQATLDSLVNKILIYNNDTGPNSGNTDFVKPLTAAYAMIDNDIASASTDTINDAGIEIAPARYVIIFLSDGSPTINEDPQIIQAIEGIDGLTGLTESLSLNTVHISPPPGSTCDVSDGGLLNCPALEFEEDAERLENMASVGDGQFRDFENNEPVNYLSFPIGNIRRSYIVQQLYVANFSAPPDSAAAQADSDSDGLSDWLELDAGLDPRDPDTDHDGFSDGVEWVVKYQESGSLDPLVFNSGCPPTSVHVDSDCDGIWDCDEQVIGGNARALDTDFDGAPDGVEWRMGTQIASKDLGFDPDSDGIQNGVELRLHSNPQVADADDLSINGYRYQLATDGPKDGQGVQCYDYSVSNVQLANTLDLGRGAGFNDLYLAFSMVPEDNPSAPTIMRHLRYQDARYPVAGIKSPADGVLIFQTTDFHDLCLPNTSLRSAAVP